jgi:MFS family permease
MTLLGGIIAYAAGVGLDTWKAALEGKMAYALLFGAATIAGMVGVGLLAATSEPAMPPAGARIPFAELMRKPLRDANFRRLLMFLGPWSFAVNLASPFFTVYMIDRLGLGMVEVIPLVICSQVANLLTLNAWGRLTDRFANKSVLAACGPLYILCFLGWTFTTFPERHALTLPLLYALHALMGVATAGVTLATGNIALKLSPHGEATSYLALVGMVSSLAAGTAPMLGGAFADWAAARALSVTFVWTGPEEAVASDILSFQHWDFFFLLASTVGAYSLHRLAAVRETGEVPSREFLRHALLSARRGLYNVSSVAGMRWLAGIPAADLLRARERGPTLQPVPETLVEERRQAA